MNYRKSLYATCRRYGNFLFMVVLIFSGAVIVLFGLKYGAEKKQEMENLLKEKERLLCNYMTELEIKSEQYVNAIDQRSNLSLDPLFSEEETIHSFFMIDDDGEVLFEYQTMVDTQISEQLNLRIDGYRLIYGIDLERWIKQNVPKNMEINLYPQDQLPSWSRKHGIKVEVDFLDGDYTVRAFQTWNTVIPSFIKAHQVIVTLTILFILAIRLIQWSHDRKIKGAVYQVSEQLKVCADMTLEEIIPLTLDSPYKEPYLLFNYFKQFCENNQKNMKNQLKSLKHELEQANYSSQAKSLFLANMSHEMRTPLNSIIGYTQLIYKIGFRPMDKVQEYIEHISGSSDILLQKINDILDLAKIEANQFELQASPQNLRTLVKEVYDLLSISANKKGLEFYYSIDPQISNYLMIDPTRFKQIIINLCSNAIKFTNKGYVKLEIELFGYINNSIVIDYRVIDTGEGIKDEDLNKIFVPFVQVGSRAKGHQGTGLGLTITRDLIKLMGGDITVSSKEHVGSIFSFTTIFEVADEQSEPVELEYPDDQIAEVIRDRKILVVEDNPINQLLIKEIFNVFQKSDVDLAEDGLEAIRMCENETYDLIFMDIQMPRCDGVEATLKLRQMKPYARVPIIALTANAFSEQVTQYLSLGMSDYLQKPLDIVRFKKVLVNYLGSS